MAPHGLDCQYAGWVYKQGSLVKTWKKRFLVLRGQELTYYDTAKVTPSVKPKGSFQVITVELSTDLQNGLLVHGRGGRVLKLYTSSPEATTTWYNMILDATSLVPQHFVATPPDRFSKLSASTASKVSSPLDDENEHDTLRHRLDSISLSDSGAEQVTTHAGWLKKEGARVKSWKRRYFVLRGNALSYFTSDDTGTAAKGSGLVRAVEVNGTVPNGLDITFEKGRVLRVAAKTSAEREVWLCKLSDAIEAAHAEQENVRESLAIRHTLRASSLRRTHEAPHTRKRSSLASVPLNPRGQVADTSMWSRSFDGKAPSLSLDDSYLSTGTSSPVRSSRSHPSRYFPHRTAPVVTRPRSDEERPIPDSASSGSTLFDSEDDLDSDESEGDWI
ncbi:hypothetical protein PsorP6_001640 [Peronosclerospora sorghi]|uniref:Uncharacterized protein n=1 Tax=Peronosclerospora sorghi TaxID=230839 RepID=A0ACC0WUD4_9STRA|nr:hypothetical protein PsorP6_001640 [Peronosclerospora sorghi]